MGRKKKGKGKIVLVAVAVIVIVAFVGYAAFSTIHIVEPSESSLETLGLQGVTGIPSSMVNNCKTVHKTEDVWAGQYASGTGYPNKEILDAESYKTTKTSSATILFRGNICTSSKTHTSVSQRGYYNVYLREIPKIMSWKKIIGLNYKDNAYVSYVDSANWRTFKSYPSDGAQTVRMPTGSFTLKGLHSGAIKMDFVVEFKSSKTGMTFQKTMATDYAFVTK